ncbi:hypothetical protein MMC22_011988 [Lobaria immixta]|nr:hypothetical protein [Lobaria immixta]
MTLPVEQSTISKYACVPGLLVTTVLSALLLYVNVAGITSHGQIYILVINYRADIQTFVQVMSHLLGLAHILVLTTCLSNRTRLQFESDSVSLDRLQWWSTMSGLRIDWSLPFQYLCPSILFAVVSFVPAALWAGAITPVFTTTMVQSTTNTSFYQPDPSGTFWNYSWAPFRANVTYKDTGSFSYSPGVDSSGQILSNAAAAISTNDTINKHSKNDLTQYFYQGRSYGVGASPGLVDPPGKNSSLVSYNYSEIGYKAAVACIKNTSSLWGWYIGQNNTGFDTPSVLFANGTFPDGKNDNFAQLGFDLSTTIVSLSGHINTKEGFLAIAGGSDYRKLNHAQCTVDFIPTNFTIGVDVVQRAINVTAINVTVDVAGTGIIDMDPTTLNGTFLEYGCNGTDCNYHNFTGCTGLGLIASQVMKGITSLSRINTSLWTSVVGDALYKNIDNANAAKSRGLIDSTLSEADLNLHAITTSVESIIDDILLGLSSSQIAIASSIKPTPAVAQVDSVRLGQASSIYAITIVNLFLIALSVYELIRTHGWRHLLVFDYRDVKSVIIATSLRGSALADYSNNEHKRAGTEWVGDPADRIVGKIQVRLAREGQGTAIVLSSSREEILLQQVNAGVGRRGTYTRLEDEE